MPVDISHIRPHIQNLDLVLNKIKYICESIGLVNNSECRNTLRPLSVRYMDIIREYSSLTHLIDNRIKRGAWIGGVGTIMKQIFGTLDENDAIKYDNAIEHVQNNQKRLASLMKENILVTTSTLSKYNETINKIKINEENLNLAIDKVSLNLKNLSEVTVQMSITSEINTLFMNLESSLLALSFELNDITNSILFSNVNVLHPSVITPRQLYTDLADNYRHLPVDTELAVELDINLIHVIMNVSKLISYYIKNRIMFVLQIPLVKPRQFYLYHNVPLPVPHNKARPDSFSVIIPSHEYVMITKDKLQYCHLDSLGKCKNTDYLNYICEVMNVFPTSENPTCESELLSKVITELPTQCKTEFIRGKLDVWKPLNNNRWIYVQSLPEKLSIDCVNSELSEVNVIGSGIVEIPLLCKAFCKNVQLIPKFNMLNVTIVPNRLDFNLINQSCCNIHKYNKVINNVPSIKLENLDLNKIDFAKPVNDRMLTELDKIIKEPHVIKYGAHYSVLTLVLVLSIIFCVIWKCYNKKKLNVSNNFLSQTDIPLTDIAVPLEIVEEDSSIDCKTKHKIQKPKEISPAKVRVNV